jgi:hypothetical protein
LTENTCTTQTTLWQNIVGQKRKWNPRQKAHTWNPRQKSVKMELYAKAQAWNNRWWEETLTRVRMRITNRDPSCAAPCCNLASHQPCLRSLDPDEWVRRQEVLAGGRKKGRVQIESPRRRRRPTPPPTPSPPESPWRNRRRRVRRKRGSERSSRK